MSAISAQPAREEVNVKADNDWTIMVFFAGDPHLSPSMTSQLKALKDAGFQANTTVLVHYDPNERGAATTTFEINRMRKQQMRERNQTPTVIGDGKDPFVRNLVEDSIPGAPRSASAIDALKQFLRLGVLNHPAKHYMLFLVGHGMIVGNDAFLPDDQPETAITLKELGKTLRAFSEGVRMVDGTVELIGLHSCSMSAIEVFYELRGAARYMMGTEGLSFVSSWPYRQLLKKLLNSVDGGTGKNVDVDGLVQSIQRLSLHNSTDFMFSGLSADLCLCRLDTDDKTMGALNDSVRNLTRALKQGLHDSRGKELILLAHLDSQSYWNETYTDLYDFCVCLARRCDRSHDIQKAMADACDALIAKLQQSSQRESIIVQSDYFGPLYQYSHGLSVYFPWSQPVHDHAAAPEDDILLRYHEYQFTRELGDDSWLSFLKEYFEATRRKSRQMEAQSKSRGEQAVSGNGTRVRTSTEPVVTASGTIINAESLRKASSALDTNRKPSGPLGVGACGCNIKNYPMEFTQSPRAEEEPNREAMVKFYEETSVSQERAPLRG